VRRGAAWPAERPSGAWERGRWSRAGRWPHRRAVMGSRAPQAPSPDHGGPRAALGVVAHDVRPPAGPWSPCPYPRTASGTDGRVGDCPASAPGAGSGRRRRHGLGWQRCELGEPWWACQDLNLGPHPYQQNAGNRCAKRRSRRSRSTVRVEVMWSHRVQLCALIAPAAALLGTSAVLAVVVRVSLVVGTLTGPLGRPSAARLAVVPATVGSGAYLPPVVCQREADLRRERRVVGAEVGEEGVPARPCHCDCDPPSSCRPCTLRRPTARLPRHDHQPGPAEAGTPLEPPRHCDHRQ
jgi:hypothetical protein